jgi:hypothetical protein
MKALELAKAATAETLAESCEAIFTSLADAEASHSEVDRVLKVLKEATDGSLTALRKDYGEFLRANDLTTERESVGTIAVRLALDAAVRLWHDPEQRAWATITIDEHDEHMPVRTLRGYLGKLYHDATDTAAHSQGLADAIGVLEGKALYEGEEHLTYIRLAEHCGRIYLDLGNDRWEAIEVSAGNWRVLESRDIPVKFRRTRGMQPLPIPTRGGSLEALAELLNLEPDDGRDGSDRQTVLDTKSRMTSRAWRLIVAWLLQALRGRGPYPIAALTGEQGSGKTSASKMVRALIDPNVSPVRTLSRDEDALMVAAVSSWVLAFDNASKLPVWVSDALCRLSTGGGLSKREHYTNQDEILLDAQRPVMLNGITDVINQQDLVDRALQIHFPPIPDIKRAPEAKMWQRFEAARPGILGALLDIVAGGLARLPDTKLERLPRLADFALWITACEPSLGWPKGAFMAAFIETRADLVRAALEDEPIVEHLAEIVNASTEPLITTSGELLERLEKKANLTEAKRKPDNWPKGPRALTAILQRIAPALRSSLNIEVTQKPRQGNARPWQLEKIDRQPSQPSQPSREANEGRPEHKNDNDGLHDGLFLSDGRPSQPSPDRHSPPLNGLPSRTAQMAHDDGHDGHDGTSPSISKMEEIEALVEEF